MKSITYAEAREIYVNFTTTNPNDLEQDTLEQYCRTLDCAIPYISKEFNIKDVNDIEYHHLLDYIYHKRNKGSKDATIRLYKVHFRSFFKVLFGLNCISKNPTVLLTLDKQNREMLPVLTKTEIRNIINVILELPDRRIRYQYYLMFCLFLVSGLRREEMANLRLKNIYFFDKKLIFTGKYDDERVVPIPKRVVEMLEEYIKWANITNQEAFLFTPNLNTLMVPYSLHSLSSYFSKLFELANVNEKCTLHSTRRTFASSLNDNKVDILVIQQLLGHADLETTYCYIFYNKKRGLLKISDRSLISGKVDIDKLNAEVEQLEKERGGL